MEYPQELLKELTQIRANWKKLANLRCTGTVAFVDLSGSTLLKTQFPTPDIWLERLSTFLDTVHMVVNETLNEPYTKNLGDGVLIFCKNDNPENFINFAETLAKRIEILNKERYFSSALSIRFTLAMDYGHDIYLFGGGDPQGLVIDRTFRISKYVVPNMVGVSSSFYKFLKDKKFKNKFKLAGKASLKGVSETWQEIYALNSIPNFSIRLSEEQKKNEALIEVWDMGKNNKPIWIVSGDIHSEGDVDVDAYSLQSGDSNALTETRQILRELYPTRNIEIVTSREYLGRNKVSYDNDIISISGPYYNSVTRELINELKLPINFELDPKKLNKHEDPIITFFEPDNKKKIFMTERKNDRIIRDVAVFIKVKNPFSKEDRYIYLIMGNQTQGTYGAAHMFAITCSHLFKNHQYLNNKFNGINQNFGEFGIITHVDMVEDVAKPVDFNSDDEIELFKLPLKYSVNTKQKGPK